MATPIRDTPRDVLSIRKSNVTILSSVLERMGYSPESTKIPDVDVAEVK